MDTFKIVAGAIFEKLDRAELPAPALRAAAGRTSIIIIVLIWSWGWTGVDLSFDSSLGGSLGPGVVTTATGPTLPHGPRVPGYLQSTPLHFRIRYYTASDEEKLALLLAE